MNITTNFSFPLQIATTASLLSLYKQSPNKNMTKSEPSITKMKKKPKIIDAKLSISTRLPEDIFHNNNSLSDRNVSRHHFRRHPSHVARCTTNSTNKEMNVTETIKARNDLTHHPKNETTTNTNETQNSAQRRKEERRKRFTLSRQPNQPFSSVKKTSPDFKKSTFENATTIKNTRKVNCKDLMPLTSKGSRIQSLLASPKKLLVGFTMFGGMKILIDQAMSYFYNPIPRPLKQSITVEVYVDPASVGSTNQLIDIIESKNHSSSNYRIASWVRLKPSSELCEKLGIKFFPMRPNTIPNEALLEIARISSEFTDVKIKISCNARWSYDTLTKLIALTRKTPSLSVDSITLYDDGTSDCLFISDWNGSGLKPALEHLKQTVDGKTLPHDFGLATLYNWQNVFPDKVIFKSLRPECFSLFKGAPFLKKYLGNSISKINWQRFSDLNQQQQNLFLSAVNFNKTELQQQYDASPNKNIIFTGTTVWGTLKQKLSIATNQINIINDIANKNSKFHMFNSTDIFFKGHPGGDIINKEVMKHFGGKIQAIPESISLEVLMMTNMLPDKVCGMAGSVYFSIPAEKIGFMVFSNPNGKTNKAEAFNDPLVKLMLKLKIIKHGNIFV